MANPGSRIPSLNNGAPGDHGFLKLGLRWVFLDLDGTIADSIAGISFSIRAAFTAREKLLSTHDLRSVIGPNIRTIFQRLDPALSLLDLDRMEQTYRQSYDSAGCLMTTLYPGVVETLENLTALHMQLFVVTNKPTLATRKVLDQLRLTSSFDEILCRDSREPCYESKSNMLMDLIARYRIDPLRAMMVGDTEEDMKAASQAQVRFLYAAYGYGNLGGSGINSINSFSEIR